MNECTIFYSMSGGLKLSTIRTLYKECFVVLSDTKPFFKLDELYFNWSSRPNDAHLAIHRLLTLDLEGYLPNNRDIAIERGVTDNAFCIPNRKINGMLSYSDIDINGLVKLESDIIFKRANCSKITKRLLVMKDHNFILSKVLNNIYRRAIYPDVDSYIKKQDEYIEFTCKYNDIDNITEITNARDYIENVLGIDYEE